MKSMQFRHSAPPKQVVTGRSNTPFYLIPIFVMGIAMLCVYFMYKQDIVDLRTKLNAITAQINNKDKGDSSTPQLLDDTDTQTTTTSQNNDTTTPSPQPRIVVHKSDFGTSTKVVDDRPSTNMVIESSFSGLKNKGPLMKIVQNPKGNGEDTKKLVDEDTSNHSCLLTAKHSHGKKSSVSMLLPQPGVTEVQGIVIYPSTQYNGALITPQKMSVSLFNKYKQMIGYKTFTAGSSSAPIIWKFENPIFVYGVRIECSTPNTPLLLNEVMIMGK